LCRALFIVFEGIDGSGTTTQSDLLARYIEEDLGTQVIQTREPGGTPLAEKIRGLVLEPDTREMHFITELFLYAASRSQHVEELIKPALQAGKPVICDRYTDSTLAYQGYGRGLDFGQISEVNSMATGGCKPDLTVYLDIPVEVAKQRRQKRASRPDRLESAGDDLQERVCRGYREVASKNPGPSLMLDATKSARELAAEVRNELRIRWPGFPFENRKQRLSI
jgi:dTMP kinase